MMSPAIAQLPEVRSTHCQGRFGISHHPL